MFDSVVHPSAEHSLLLCNQKTMKENANKNQNNSLKIIINTAVFVGLIFLTQNPLTALIIFAIGKLIFSFWKIGLLVLSICLIIYVGGQMGSGSYSSRDYQQDSRGSSNYNYNAKKDVSQEAKSEYLNLSKSDFFEKMSIDPINVNFELGESLTEGEENYTALRDAVTFQVISEGEKLKRVNMIGFIGNDQDQNEVTTLVLGGTSGIFIGGASDWLISTLLEGLESGQIPYKASKEYNGNVMNLVLDNINGNSVITIEIEAK